MKARKILIIALPILLLGLTVVGAVATIQDADSTSAEGAEQPVSVVAETADSLVTEPDRPVGLRENLRRRLHVMRVLIDVVLGLLERGLDADSSGIGSGA
jgi:hypothetical protein